MNRRVSRRLPSMANVLTRTEPIGRSQSPSGFTVIVLSSGNARKRVLSAPSDHSGETTSYGIRPAAGFSGSDGSTQPVSDNSFGNVSGAVGADGTNFEIAPLICTV